MSESTDLDMDCSSAGFSAIWTCVDADPHTNEQAGRPAGFSPAQEFPADAVLKDGKRGNSQ